MRCRVKGMVRKYPHLSSPIKIAGITLKNRMISAPMTFPDITTEGYMTSEATAFFELRAKGGAAAVTIGEACVQGKRFLRNISLEAEGVMPGLTNAARAIKRHGAIASIELIHGGKYSVTQNTVNNALDGKVSYGPSTDVLPDGTIVEEMSKKMIRETVEAFGRGAALCKRAGFQMILLHGGHGWLPHQFLSPASNYRTDDYGGSLENRARFTCEVLDNIRKAVGRDFPIEIRISADEYLENGYGLDMAIEFAKIIENKVDLLQVSTGSVEGCFHKAHLPMFAPRGYNVRYAAEIKKHVKVPVATLGALNDPEMMEEIIATGKADVVEMARALVADPYLPKKAFMGKDKEIVRCIRCMTCLWERFATDTIACSVNPVVGREFESRFVVPASDLKKVLVAGGGPGGMQTAITAAERGHKVILCEKKGELGGALRCERSIPFKQDLYNFVAVKTLEMEKAGVDVRRNTEVTRQFVEQEAPDVLVLAVGAEPVLPVIPGIDSPKVVVANNISAEQLKIGQRVVILGGGLVGCEAGIHLAQEGKEVTVIEMEKEVASDANGRHRPVLLEYLNNLTTVETGMRGVRVVEEGLVCVDENGKEKTFPSDTIICAVGQRPLRDIVNDLLDSAPEVIQVGDCVETKQLIDAVSRGYGAGLDI